MASDSENQQKNQKDKERDGCLALGSNPQLLETALSVRYLCRSQRELPWLVMFEDFPCVDLELLCLPAGHEDHLFAPDEQ